jgi:alpha-beta hydrolase superfamily lysophospholipase
VAAGESDVGRRVPPRARQHIGSYEPFTEAFNAEGIAVWASDHLGHGRSEGERVLIERIDDLVDDAEQLVRAGASPVLRLFHRPSCQSGPTTVAASRRC